MDHSHQLAWVQKNRAKRDRTQPAGSLMAEFARSVEVGEAASHLAVRVAEVVDDEFRRHCRIGGLRSGTLTIYVDEASLVWAMRARWSTPLQQAMSRMTGLGRVNTITFAYGDAGVPLSGVDARQTGVE